MAPARRRRATTTASRAGTWLLSVGKPAVVVTPATSNVSFTVHGTPWKGPHHSPRARASSAARARERGVAGERDDRVDFRVETRDPVEHARRQLDGGDVAAADRAGGLERRGEVEVGDGGARGARGQDRRPDDREAAAEEGAPRQAPSVHRASRAYCFTETPRTANPGFVATNGTARLLSVRTKAKLSVPVPPLRIVQTADPVPLGFTVYVHVKVWWSTTPPALRVRTPSVRLPFPSASKTPTAATGTAVVPLTMVPSRENP